MIIHCPSDVSVFLIRTCLVYTATIVLLHSIMKHSYGGGNYPVPEPRTSGKVGTMSKRIKIACGVLGTVLLLAGMFLGHNYAALGGTTIGAIAGVMGGFQTGVVRNAVAVDITCFLMIAVIILSTAFIGPGVLAILGGSLLGVVVGDDAVTAR